MPNNALRTTCHSLSLPFAAGFAGSLFDQTANYCREDDTSTAMNRKRPVLGGLLVIDVSRCPHPVRAVDIWLAETEQFRLASEYAVILKDPELLLV